MCFPNSNLSKLKYFELFSIKCSKTIVWRNTASIYDYEGIKMQILFQFAILNVRKIPFISIYRSSKSK